MRVKAGVRKEKRVQVRLIIDGGRMLGIGRKKELAEYNPQLTREELIKRCRILVIDDEKPSLIDDLSRDGFAVDYDNKGDDVSKIEKNIYDLVLLDFGGVGMAYGRDQGLSLLKHIKRVNPATFVLAYTSKSLPPEQSAFYRLTDGTLYKDAGIQESFERIEQSLRQALNVERIWDGIVQLALKNPEDRGELEKTLMRCLKKKKFDNLYDRLAHEVGQSVKDGLVGGLVAKLIDLAMKGAVGG
jgi:DNA-binding NarL/FixJ family response regulator